MSSNRGYRHPLSDMKNILLTLTLSALAAFGGTLEDTAARNAALPDYAALHKLVQNTNEPMLWLFVGDSITHGACHTNGERSYTELWQEVIKWEYGTNRQGVRKNDIIVNSGVSGETATGFLKEMPWRLNQFKPQVVFINFGVNDAMKIKDLEKFKTDLAAIVKAVRRKNAIPVLQVPTPTYDGLATRPGYADAVREVAAQKKVLLADHAAYWKEISGSDEAKREWMNNNLHPNGAGHRIMVKVLATELGLVPTRSQTVK